MTEQPAPLPAEPPPPQPPPLPPSPAPEATVPAPVPAPPPAPSEQKPTVEQMREALKEVYDPEIPINIVDLGLLYKIAEHDGNVEIEMTLTSPHCPLGYQFQERVREVIGALPGITAVNVALVFEPPWTKEKMTPDGKLQAAMLGFM